MKEGRNKVLGEIDRRSFFARLLLRASALASSLSVLLPIPRFLLGGRTTGGGTSALTDAGPVGNLRPGTARSIVHRGRPALLIHLPSGPVAVGAVCTHLGCVVRWDEKRGELRCPCHGARFDPEGRVLGGPTRTPLRPIPVRTDTGSILLG